MFNYVEGNYIFVITYNDDIIGIHGMALKLNMSVVELRMILLDEYNLEYIFLHNISEGYCSKDKEIIEKAVDYLNSILTVNKLEELK